VTTLAKLVQSIASTRLPFRARRSAIPPQQTAIYVAGVPAAIVQNCSDLNKPQLLS